MCHHCACLGRNLHHQTQEMNAQGTLSPALAASTAFGTEILLAPWLSAAGSSEAVSVYSSVSTSSAEYGTWTGIFNYVDALIDKDFTYTSNISGADVTLNHTSLPSGTLGHADYIDGGIDDGEFDIGLDTSQISQLAGTHGLNESDYYRYIAAHELGHALGLKHPFDDVGGLPANSSASSSDTVMAYGDAGYFTSLDIAALIEKNGIEDDFVGGEAPIFRFYNQNNGGHFFTSSVSEATFVATELYETFVFDGTAFYASASSAALSNSEAIYRFYNQSTGGHFFTADAGERDFVQTALANQYTYEGIGFYAAASDDATSDPVYRFYNASSAGHFFTSSTAERDLVLGIDSFTYEGIGFYA